MLVLVLYLIILLELDSYPVIYSIYKILFAYSLELLLEVCDLLIKVEV
jgi:hypothetical protein